MTFTRDQLALRVLLFVYIRALRTHTNVRVYVYTCVKHTYVHTPVCVHLR